MEESAMIFRLVSQLVERAWPLILLGWCVLLAGTWLAAPPWNEVAQDKEFAFLPADVPSRRAEEVFAQAYPEEQLSSNIVLVLHRNGQDRGHLEADRKFIEDVIEPGLRKIAEAEGGLAAELVVSDAPLFGDEPAPEEPAKKRSIIARIRTPNALGTGAFWSAPTNKLSWS